MGMRKFKDEKKIVVKGHHEKWNKRMDLGAIMKVKNGVSFRESIEWYHNLLRNTKDESL